jgi:hypothetical protein
MVIVLPSISMSTPNKFPQSSFFVFDILYSKLLLTFINIYGSNNDTPLFYNKVSESIEYFNNHSTILTGDYSLVQDQI